MSDTRKKVILVNTSMDGGFWEGDDRESIGIPYGLLSIGTILEQNGYSPVIIDPTVERDWRERLDAEIPGALWVGVTTMTAGLPHAIQIARRVRELSPATPIVWGGIHPTLFPLETAEDALVDVVCIGEGEYTALDLTRAFEGSMRIEDVAGIAYKKDGRPAVTPPRAFIDVNELPPVNYDLVDMEKYLSRDLESFALGKGRVRIMVLHSGRGCPYKCTFCINTHPTQKFRNLSIEKLTDHIERVVNRYAPEVIYFQDDNFFATPSRVRAFLDVYDRKGWKFRWFTLTRANYFHDDYLNDDVLTRMEGRALWLGMGVESGSERILKKLRKEITFEQVDRAAGMLRKHSIPAGFAFITAVPGETLPETVATVRYILKLKKIHPGASFAFQYFRPYPGSELYEEVRAMDYRLPDTIHEWAEEIGGGEKNYLALEKFPWVRNPALTRYLITALNNSLYDRRLIFAESRSLPYKILKFAYYIFWETSLRFRLRSGFWGLLFESRLHDAQTAVRKNG